VFFLFVIIKIFEAFYKVGIETYTKDQGFIWFLESLSVYASSTALLTKYNLHWKIFTRDYNRYWNLFTYWDKIELHFWHTEYKILKNRLKKRLFGDFL
jgi:hypothetical protein